MDTHANLLFSLAVHIGCGMLTTSMHTTWIDLTYTFDESVAYHPLASPFQMEVLNGSLNGYPFQAELISTNTHTGTHLDAPSHFVPGQWSADEIPITHLINLPAVVIDISEKSKLNPDYLLETEDILEWEEEHGQMPDRSVLIMYTGYGEYFNDTKRYFGITDTNSTELHFPGLSPNAAQWIVDNRNLYGIGTDAASIEGAQTKDSNAHIIVEQRNIYSLESLANVDKIPPHGAHLLVMPMKIGGAGGAPCRVFAQFPNHF